MSESIAVIGVGGGGCNAVDHLLRQGMQGVRFIHSNTDAQVLSRSNARYVLQLGHTGLRTGSKPQQGKAAAEYSIDRIRHAIDGAKTLFIAAGLGGGTGTGAAPVIARVAKEMGISTIGVVTMPFEFEGNRRMAQAKIGVTELQCILDKLIIVSNENSLEVLGDDITQEVAFAKINDVLRNAILARLHEIQVEESKLVVSRLSTTMHLSPNPVVRSTSQMKSTFISYGAPDEEFATRLNTDLCKHGVKTFFFPRDAIFGEKLHVTMKRVNDFDQVILICSENSLGRNGLQYELEKVLEREALDGGSSRIIPVALDGFLFDNWRPNRESLRTELITRVVADFRSSQQYDLQLDRLVKALRI